LYGEVPGSNPGSPTKKYGDSFSIKYRGKTRKSIIAIVGEWTSFIRERKEEVVEIPIQSQ
jgi:hypothetical protein